MSDTRPAIVKDFAQMVHPIPTSETDVLICDDCETQSTLDKWTLIEDSVYCEICGEHDGLKCPVCGAIHDYIFPRIHLFKQ